MCDRIHEFALPSCNSVPKGKSRLSKRRRSQVIQHCNVLFVKNDRVITLLNLYSPIDGCDSLLDDRLRQYSRAVLPVLLYLFPHLLRRELIRIAAWVHDIGCQINHCAHAYSHPSLCAIQWVL